MKYIIGIGNPGREYEKTRHNTGFQVLDVMFGRREKIFKRWTLDKSLESVVAEDGDGLFLIKPQTYVNVSGTVVASLMKRSKLDLKDLLVVSDDANLEFGSVRIRAEGSDGGHHGLLSIAEALGSRQYPRLRVGIRNESMPRQLAEFVLSGFSPEEKRQLPEILERAATACERWAGSDYKAAVEFLSKPKEGIERK